MMPDRFLACFATSQFPRSQFSHSGPRRSWLTLRPCRLAIPIFVLAILYIQPPASAGMIVAQHIGLTNPETEGWTPILRTGSDVLFGPISESSDFGSLDAWFVDDNSSLGPSVRMYGHDLSGEELAGALNFGWTLRANIRIVDLSDDPGRVGGSVRFRLETGNRVFNINLGSTDVGDPVVRMLDRQDVSNIQVGELTGGGNGYHLYELVYDPTSATADLFIDGTEFLSDYAGYSESTGQGVLWGSGSGEDTGRGHYNLVQFEIGNATVPEPTTLSFVAIGLLCSIGRRNRLSNR